LALFGHDPEGADVQKRMGALLLSEAIRGWTETPES
jgi:hypothetical protein